MYVYSYTDMLHTPHMSSIYQKHDNSHEKHITVITRLTVFPLALSPG